MSDNTFWYGYLDAGEKSSPVLRDERIATDNPDTVYLFNLRRGEILEYRRDLVEPKLRELKAAEATASEELKAGYSEACRNFTPRGSRPVIAERGRGSAAAAQKKPEEELDVPVEAGIDGDDDWSDEDEED